MAGSRLTVARVVVHTPAALLVASYRGTMVVVVALALALATWTPARASAALAPGTSLTPPAGASASFGSSVATSDSTALVGDPGVGAVTAYTGQTTTSLDNPTASTGFGTSVAISGDLAVVGDPSATPGGAAYVYTETNGTWDPTPTATLAAPTGATEFGTSVAIDGETALVGDPGNGDGTASVYDNPDASGTQNATTTLTAPAGANAFGTSVAVSGDLAVIGAPGSGSDQADPYENIRGSTPTADTALTDAGTTNFGSSVALSGDTAIVGGHGATPGAAAYTDTGGPTWTQSALPTPVGATASFGASVAISGDTAIVGDSGGNTAYVFTDNSGTWSDTEPLFGAAQLGRAVALSPDDNTAVIGKLGAATTYVPQTVALTAGATPSTVTYGNTVIVSAAGLPTGATGTVTFATTSQTLCSAAVSNGAAQCTTPVLGPGTYSITAGYSGEAGQYAAATASTSLTVTLPAPTTTTTTTTPFTFVIPPSVQITAPLNGARYTRNQVVRAGYACTDGSNAPGLSYCQGSVPDGQAIDTSKPGRHTFSVTGASRSGESTMRTLSYTVYLASNALDVQATRPRGNGRGTVTAGVAGPGTVTVLTTTWPAGRRQPRLGRQALLARGSAGARRAGPVRVTLAPAPAGRRLLASEHGRRVNVRVAITFSPRGGNSRTVVRYAVLTLS